MRVGHHAQVSLDAAFEDDARFRLALRDDADDAGHLHKVSDDAGRIRQSAPSERAQGAPRRVGVALQRCRERDAGSLEGDPVETLGEQAGSAGPRVAGDDEHAGPCAQALGDNAERLAVLSLPADERGWHLLLGARRQ